MELIIKEEFLEIEELNLIDKLILTYIYQTTNKDTRIFFEQDALGKKIGMTGRAVGRCFRKLHEMGYIEYVKQPHKKYYLINKTFKGNQLPIIYIMLNSTKTAINKAKKKESYEKFKEYLKKASKYHLSNFDAPIPEWYNRKEEIKEELMTENERNEMQKLVNSIFAN